MFTASSATGTSTMPMQASSTSVLADCDREVPAQFFLPVDPMLVHLLQRYNTTGFGHLQQDIIDGSLSSGQKGAGRGRRVAVANLESLRAVPGLFRQFLHEMPTVRPGVVRQEYADDDQAYAALSGKFCRCVTSGQSRHSVGQQDDRLRRTLCMSAAVEHLYRLLQRLRRVRAPGERRHIEGGFHLGSIVCAWIERYFREVKSLRIGGAQGSSGSRRRRLPTRRACPKAYHRPVRIARAAGLHLIDKRVQGLDLHLARTGKGQGQLLVFGLITWLRAEAGYVLQA